MEKSVDPSDQSIVSHGTCSNHQQVTKSIVTAVRLELPTEMPGYYIMYLQLS